MDRNEAVANPESLLRAALAAAERGWRIFPLCPSDKRPVRTFTRWETHATAEPEKIRRFWGKVPYNIAVACGPSGLVVIDLDLPKDGQRPPAEWSEPGIHDGLDAFAALCERHGEPLPFDTFSTRTRRGGLHLYFAAPEGVRLTNTTGGTFRGLAWLVDTRANGGYVVGPGSFVDLEDGAGSYEILHDRSPAPLPAWLVELLTPPPRREADQVSRELVAARLTALGSERLGRYAYAALSAEVQTVLDAAPHTRNNTLYEAARSLGQLIGAGLLPRDMAEEALRIAGESVGQSPREAHATIASGIRTGLKSPRRVA
jgi:hypothetical protein